MRGGKKAGKGRPANRGGENSPTPKRDESARTTSTDRATSILKARPPAGIKPRPGAFASILGHVAQRDPGSGARIGAELLPRAPERLYKSRDGKAWTQQDIATMLGVARQTVTDWLAPVINIDGSGKANTAEESPAPAAPQTPRWLAWLQRRRGALPSCYHFSVISPRLNV